VDAPRDPTNRLEVVYEDPALFKTLFAYFKNLRAREIHLRCAPRGLTFYARDHTRTSRVVAHLAGEHANWYYCEGTHWLGLNRDGVEKMFAAIDKTFYKVTVLQQHEDPNRLSFVFRDAEVDKECHYRVPLSTYPPDEELYEAEGLLAPGELAAAFPVEFVLPARLFKKTVADAACYSSTLTVEKIGERPLQFAYAQPHMGYLESYHAPEKIRLRADLPPGATFRCTVKVANVRSLAASMVFDDVRVLCREAGDLLFQTALDTKALIVNTLTRLA
jgi:hypothetical protein